MLREGWECVKEGFPDGGNSMCKASEGCVCVYIFLNILHIQKSAEKQSVHLMHNYNMIPG